MENQPFQPQPNQQPVNNPQPVIVQKSHRGFSLLAWLLILLLAAGGVGTYLWQHNKVTKLQSQLASSESRKTTSASTSSNTTASSSQEFLYLNNYGLKIPLTTDIQDLYYVQFKDSLGNNVLVFSSQSLANAEPGCFAVPTTYAYSYESLSLDNKPPKTLIDGTPFGLVIVTSQPAPAGQVGSTDQDIGSLLAHSNSYYFYYKQAQGTCLATDSKGSVVSQTNSNLLSGQLTSFLTAMKKVVPIN